MTVLGTEGLRGLSAEERNRRLRGLSFDAARALAETLSADDLNDERIACIEALARCVPGSTAPIAERLATREVKVHPLVLVAGGARVRDVLLARLRRFDGTRPERASAESTQLNAILLGLAWLGRDDDAVVRLFASWRKEQPSWACALYAKPDQYAHEAGWTREYEALAFRVSADGTFTWHEATSRSPQPYERRDERWSLPPMAVARDVVQLRRFYAFLCVGCSVATVTYFQT